MSYGNASRLEMWRLRNVDGNLHIRILLTGCALLIGSSNLAAQDTKSFSSLAAPRAPVHYLDDASRLNRTAVAEVVLVPHDPDLAIRQLASLLEKAKRDGLKVSIGGARHSMGGHTLYPGGIHLDMSGFDRMSFDPGKRLMTVGSGATWDEILPFLDKNGFSVEVMQSNNSFSVGGSISVNCHGWQQNHAPIASTVESFRLLKADGTVVRCARTENEELFSLVLGGYGLFGVILDVEMNVVPNRRYRREQLLLNTFDYPGVFDEKVEGSSEVQMAYGRLSVSPNNFLEEAILNVLYDDPAKGGKIPNLREPGMRKLRRSIFRNSVGSDFGKKFRWSAEKNLESAITKKYVTRNQLLNEGVETFENRSTRSTDILHEYFVPRDRFCEFIEMVRRIVPYHEGNLLNVTVRDIYPDEDTFLKYADCRMFAFVMLFNQPFGPTHEAKMESLTREMIDAALDCGGRYYLPYRLHATPHQFQKAYPMAPQFFELKKKYDPDEIFQNQFYKRYGSIQD